jgi:type IV pilus assembly protein PilQ
MSNKHLEYKLYNIAEPPRVVIDLFPALRNPFNNPIGMNSPLVTQIDVEKLDIKGRSVTRIIFKLKRPVVFSASEDPSNKTNILLAVAKTMASPPVVKEGAKTGTAPKADSSHTVPASNNKTPAAALNSLAVAKTKENPSAVKEGAKDGSAQKADSSHTVQASNSNYPAAVLKSGDTGVPTHSEAPSGIGKPASPTNAVPVEDKPPKLLMSSATDKNRQDKDVKLVQAGDRLTIYKVNVIRNGVEIVVRGVNNNFKLFELGGPKRLVLDIFGAKSAVENTLVPVNSFGIKTIRLGSHPQKVRIVFDASGKVFPAYRVELDDLGMKLLFDKI